jgi:hypothetical protein
MDTWRTDLAALPAFAHLAPWLNQINSTHWPNLHALNHLAEQRKLRNRMALPVQFTQQTRRCSQHDYEIGIYQTGQVPSRENNWHDFFNALTWLAFPETKAALNAVHHAVLPRGSNRTSASDAATLFDESGLVLLGKDNTIANLIAARRWQEALVERREDWQHLQAYVVGHAVLEKLLTPWPGITAKCLFIQIDTNAHTDTNIRLDKIDAAIAQHWQTSAMTQPGALFPMPVLGIPGWWPANETRSFYADEKVFRPARTDTKTNTNTNKSFT